MYSGNDYFTMKKLLVYLRYVSAIFFVFLLIPEKAYSVTKPVPYSYKQETVDGKFIFVMLAPNKERDGLGLSPENREKALALQKQYTLSGLYLVNNSTEPLWTVDWYSNYVYLSADGKYLAKIGLNWSSSSDEAISFFEANNLKKTYKIADLVAFAWLMPESFLSEWGQEFTFNQESNTLTIKTITYDTLVFDLKSGDLIKSFRPVWLILIALVFFILLITFIYLKRKNLTTKRV